MAAPPSRERLAPPVPAVQEEVEDDDDEISDDDDDDDEVPDLDEGGEWRHKYGCDVIDREILGRAEERQLNGRPRPATNAEPAAEQQRQCNMPLRRGSKASGFGVVGQRWRQQWAQAMEGGPMQGASVGMQPSMPRGDECEAPPSSAAAACSPWHAALAARLRHSQQPPAAFDRPLPGTSTGGTCTFATASGWWTNSAALTCAGVG